MNNLRGARSPAPLTYGSSAAPPPQSQPSQGNHPAAPTPAGLDEEKFIEDWVNRALHAETGTARREEYVEGMLACAKDDYQFMTKQMTEECKRRTRAGDGVITLADVATYNAIHDFVIESLKKSVEDRWDRKMSEAMVLAKQEYSKKLSELPKSPPPQTGAEATRNNLMSALNQQQQQQQQQRRI